MFSLTKKRDDQEDTSTHTPPEGESERVSSPSHPEEDRDREKEECEEPHTENQDEISISESEQQEPAVVARPSKTASPDTTHNQPVSGNTATNDGGCHTDEVFSSLPEQHRPRRGSLASSTTSAASSYHTAVSGHDHGSVTSGGATSEREVTSERESVRLFSALEELRHSMTRMVHEMVKKLESKIESVESRLGSRMEAMERQVRLGQSDVQQSVSGEGEGQCTGLPTLKEVESERDSPVNEATDKSSPQPQQAPKKVRPGLFRRFTDFELARMAQHSMAMNRRKQYGQQKSLSFQDSGVQLLQKSCSQQVIMWLTQKVHRWKFIARWLGLSEAEVDTIFTDHPHDGREQCYQMFLKWRSVDPDNYTYPVLGEALRRESMELFNEFVKEVHRVETDNIDLSSYE